MSTDDSIKPMAVFLDNNAWDFFYARGLNPCTELPPPQFKLKITREAEFEIEAIPTSKQELRDFIAKTRAECIQTHMYFGFSEASESPSESRFGGFDVGVWASDEEIQFMHSERESIGKVKRSTRLYPNEADVSLAARSLASVVLTCDSVGVLKRVSSQGGRVVNLLGFDQSELSVKEFIMTELNKSAEDA